MSIRRRIALWVCPELQAEINDQAYSVSSIVSGHLITLAETWGAHAGLKLSTVSTYAANDGKFFCNLKKGSGCTLKTASRLLQWFSDNWDDEAIEWPEGIPRPSKSEQKQEVA